MPVTQLVQKYRPYSYTQSILDEAEALGVRCTISSDFEEFLRVSAALKGKARPISLFNPDITNLSRHNAFWIKGVDPDGEIVHIQAIKYIDLEDQRLADHFQHNSHLYMIQDVGIDLTQSEFHNSPKADRIFGKICYHGENWYHKSLRGRALSILLPRLAMGLAHQRWRPDYMIGFVPPKLAYKGIGVQYGYSGTQPGVIKWFQPAQNRYSIDWLVWADQEDLDYLLSHSAIEEMTYLAPREAQIHSMPIGAA